MKVEENKPVSVQTLIDRCRSARQILVAHETKRLFPSGKDAIMAAAIVPESLPDTRATATPHVLLMGPFQDEPDLTAVAIYVGIGIIEVHNVGDVHATYGFCAIEGDGNEERYQYLLAAFGLYFKDVTLQESGN